MSDELSRFHTPGPDTLFKVKSIVGPVVWTAGRRPKWAVNEGALLAACGVIRFLLASIRVPV